MWKQLFIVLFCISSILSSCSLNGESQGENTNNESVAMVDSSNKCDGSVIKQNRPIVSTSSTIAKEQKMIVPKFSILRREREDFNEYTPRTRFHIKTPKLYTELELNIIADSLLKKERYENGISEIWVNYYLPNKKIHHSNSYGLSMRLRTESSSTIFQKEEKKHGYNPPKARDLSNTTIRARQIWGAFDQGQIAGYEVGFRDGKKRRRVFFSFDSDYPTSDEWIEQSYKQGYEVGYLNGFDDAGGSR